MRKISPSLQHHLEQQVTTLANCWHLKLLNGKEIGFTEHDRPLELSGIKYFPSHSLYCSAIENTSGLQADNLQIKIAIGEHIHRDDILSAQADGAAIEIFLVNFMDLDAGRITLFYGYISSIKLSECHFTAELKSYSDQLNNTIGELYSPRCRADFCDPRCGLPRHDFTQDDSITTVLDEISFSSTQTNQVDGFYNYGSIHMLTGDNAGLTFAIEGNHAGVLVLTLPPPHPLHPGDKYTITAGCDKRFETCRDRFHNAVNFRGEPNIPGYDDLV